MACCAALLSGPADVHILIQDFFEWLGHALGTLIRFIVEALSGFFGLFADIGRSFLDGMASALGTDVGLLSIVAMVCGLLLLYAAVRAGMRKAFVRMVIYGLLGLWLLSLIVS
jgi:spore maturation protein SpmA